jgi:CDGSH-type Zn-finger protein/uncharacterized Fe-S cluster protein YjdI
MSEHRPVAVIENREHLFNLLGEAAEIEHNLMCCYLYAVFSLKQSADEDLTEEELAAVKRWRRKMMGVAIDEMAHLALVANLTSAVGGAPHFGRFNFPIPAGAHPAGIQVKLAPFNQDTLRHFIYLERPEGSTIGDGVWFVPERRYDRIAIPGRLMPSSHDYETVGALYRSIRDGLDRLAEEYGEAALFVGDKTHQLGPELANLPNLTRVRCLKTANAALDGIVINGEGAPGHSEDCHYQRFLDIQKEYEALLAKRPGFVPARHAAHNPVMRHPPTPEDKIYIDLDPAASMLDLANATYVHMLRLLVQAYAETRGERAQRAQVDAAVALMYATSDVASALTRQPASSAHPGCTAGMSFATVRGATALPSGPAADKVLIERMEDIAAGAARLAAVLPPDVPARFAHIAARFSTDLTPQVIPRATPGETTVKTTSSNGTSGTTSDAPAPTAAPGATPAVARGPSGAPVPVSKDGIDYIEGKGLTLIYEGKRCIHSRHCVLEQPAVFKANVVGPWIDPDATSTEQLAALAFRCVSGAIRFKRKDGGEEEPVPPVNLVQIRENGPLGVRAELVIDGVPSSSYRATLCRCGASKNKPFCDGSHVTIGFAATGEPTLKPVEALAVRNGPLEIRPQRNGNLEVRGNLEMISGTGHTFDKVTTVRLCRCGGSSNKPYCDGTHARIGFTTE